jgi:Bifunctional DNA primase/polymerase, N-terminal
MNRGKREQLSRRLRSWAHGYARRGWPMFALAEGTNVPALSTFLGGHGFRDATCDPDLVDQLWSWFR